MERNITSIANHLNKDIYKVHIVAGKTDGDCAGQLNRDVMLIDFSAASVLKMFFPLCRYLRNEKPDILVSAGVALNIVSVLAKICSGIPVKIVAKEINTFSLLGRNASSFKSRLAARYVLPLMVWWLYPKTDALVCVSRGVMDDLLSYFPRLQCMDVRVIGNIVDGALLSMLMDQPVSHPWFTQDNLPIIITAARLVRAKDYPTLLRAFALAVKKTPCRLVILGEGGERPFLEVLAKNLGISTWVAFLGFQKNPYRFMKGASVFVLASKEEGFGTVILEAMQCGLPVIATECAGPKEIIKHGKNGILVSMSDHVAMAQELGAVLNNHDLAQRIAKEGSLRAQDFTPLKITEKYHALFTTLLNIKNHI